MRRLIAMATMIATLWATAGVAVGQQASATVTLVAVEEALYGQEQRGGLLERLQKLERDIYGQTQTGALMERLSKLQAFLTSSEFAGASLLLRINVVEWSLFMRTSEPKPLIRRVDELETVIYGAPRSGPIGDRVGNLVREIWPTGELNVRAMDLPKETLVRISLQTEINSGKNQAGQSIRYRVVEDVLIDNRIIIPSGAEGVGRVISVESAGRLGRGGRVEVDFGTITALDGTAVPVQVAERAITENRGAQDAAAAASVAGVLLLGPIGLVGGYFVRGQEHVVPPGTTFFVEVSRPVRVSGLSLTPVR